MDSAKQDWFTVSSLLENALDTIKKQMPFIKEVMLRSNNAGCYHCGQFLFFLATNKPKDRYENSLTNH